jgi:hypothetical protein
MRTKALLSLAALAVGAATAVAQSNVYSINVVGYYNVVLPANTSLLVGNQLNTTNNTLPGVIPSTTPGAQFQKFNGGFSAYTFDPDDNAWVPDATGVTLAPGEGGFIRAPSATTVTFVGEVRQGLLTNNLPVGTLVIRGSIVPQATNISGLGLIPPYAEPGDQLQTFHGGYNASTFDPDDNAWLPTDQNIAVGEGFFYRKSPTGTNPNWVRNFTVQ